MTIRLTGALAVLLAAHVAGGTAVAQTGAARQPSNPTRPGQTFKECRNCPEMVVVPSGSFVMGSPADEPDRRARPSLIPGGWYPYDMTIKSIPDELVRRIPQAR